MAHYSFDATLEEIEALSQAMVLVSEMQANAIETLDSQDEEERITLIQIANTRANLRALMEKMLAGMES